MVKILLVISLFYASSAFSATVSEATLDSRVTEVTQQLRCLVCQNESIAESQADLARDLRKQVRTMLASGKSEDEVRQFMTARYGDFVLYDPPFQLATAFLWLGPAILVLLALTAFIRILIRRKKQPISVTSEQLAQARESITHTEDRP